MSTRSKAWLLIAIPDQRQYGGNQGYDDEPASTYRYDSAVPNSRRVSPGDLVLLRDRETLLGLGLVERIVAGSGTKKRFRCPDCNVTGIKERRGLSPRWRCHNGHTFAEALEEDVSVTRYEAHYGSTFLPADGRIFASEIRLAAVHASDQLSIQELDPGKLERLLVKSFPEAVAPINPICRRNPSIPGLCRIASPTCARPFKLSLPWSVRLSSAARRCILRTLPCDSSLPP